MELVKLKMKTSYKLCLFLIFVLFCLSVSLYVYTYYYKDNSDDNSLIEVNGELSYNYLDGKKINVSDKESIKFTVSNNNEETYTFILKLVKVRGEGTYKLYNEKTLLEEGSLTVKDEEVIATVDIEGNATNTYILEISNSGISNLKSELNISTEDIKSTKFNSLILKNVEVSSNALTKVGSDVSTEDEGLIKSTDDLGTSYYFRGNINYNYVSFGGLLWRIVRINGDDTVRLVLNDKAGLSLYYNEETEEINYDNSLIKSYLSEWVNDNLKDYMDYIASSKYCSDIKHDDLYTYNAYTRIVTNKIPSLNCLGEELTDKVGLLTIDEVILAGANMEDSNTSYYLYNSEITDSYYTLSAAKGSSDNIYMFMVNQNGSINMLTTGNLYRGVRPVINLVKNIEMKGTGTIDDPYTLKSE